jgi:hypothetical protein
MINVAPHYTRTQSIRKQSTGKGIWAHKNGSIATTIKCTTVNTVTYRYYCEYETAAVYRAYRVNEMTEV